MGCSCYIGCSTRAARLKWVCLGAAVSLCFVCNMIGNSYMAPCRDPVTMGYSSAHVSDTAARCVWVYDDCTIALNNQIVLCCSNDAACVSLESVDPHNEECQKPLEKFYECTSRVIVELIAFAFLTDYFLLMAVVVLCLMCCCSKGPPNDQVFHVPPVAHEVGLGIRTPLLRPTV